MTGIPRGGLVALAALVVVACGSTTASITPAAGKSAAPAASPTPTPAPTPTPTSSVPITQLLTKCAAPQAFASLHRFATVTGAGDIDVGADGSVWVSSVTHGVIAHLSPTGAALASYNQPTPAGLVALSDGSVLFADQGADRIVRFDPATLAVTTFLQLTPRPGQPNVTGLGVDAANSLLLVPDTAQGRILTVPLSGGGSTPLATGLSRPVDAAAGPGNVIEVAASVVGGLLAVPTSGGAAKRYTTVNLVLSAVVVKGLLVYFTAPPSHRVYAFNPATGHTAVLVTAISNPQGIALLSDGQLVVSDATSGTLATLQSC